MISLLSIQIVSYFSFLLTSTEDSNFFHFVEKVVRLDNPGTFIVKLFALFLADEVLYY